MQHWGAIPSDLKVSGFHSYYYHPKKRLPSAAPVSQRVNELEKRVRQRFARLPKEDLVEEVTDEHPHLLREFVSIGVPKEVESMTFDDLKNLSLRSLEVRRSSIQGIVPNDLLPADERKRNLLEGLQGILMDDDISEDSDSTGDGESPEHLNGKTKVVAPELSINTGASPKVETVEVVFDQADAVMSADRLMGTASDLAEAQYGRRPRRGSAVALNLTSVKSLAGHKVPGLRLSETLPDPAEANKDGPMPHRKLDSLDDIGGLPSRTISGESPDGDLPERPSMPIAPPPMSLPQLSISSVDGSQVNIWNSPRKFSTQRYSMFMSERSRGTQGSMTSIGSGGDIGKEEEGEGSEAGSSVTFSSITGGLRGPRNRGTSLSERLGGTDGPADTGAVRSRTLTLSNIMEAPQEEMSPLKTEEPLRTPQWARELSEEVAAEGGAPPSPVTGPERPAGWLTSLRSASAVSGRSIAGGSRMSERSDVTKDGDPAPLQVGFGLAAPPLPEDEEATPKPSSRRNSSNAPGQQYRRDRRPSMHMHAGSTVDMFQGAMNQTPEEPTVVRESSWLGRQRSRAKPGDEAPRLLPMQEFQEEKGLTVEVSDNSLGDDLQPTVQLSEEESLDILRNLGSRRSHMGKRRRKIEIPQSEIYSLTMSPLRRPRLSMFRSDKTAEIPTVVEEKQETPVIIRVKKKKKRWMIEGDGDSLRASNVPETTVDEDDDILDDEGYDAMQDWATKLGFASLLKCFGMTSANAQAVANEYFPKDKTKMEISDFDKICRIPDFRVMHDRVYNIEPLPNNLAALRWAILALDTKAIFMGDIANARRTFLAFRDKAHEGILLRKEEIRRKRHDSMAATERQVTVGSENTDAAAAVESLPMDNRVSTMSQMNSMRNHSRNNSARNRNSGRYKGGELAVHTAMEEGSYGEADQDVRYIDDLVPAIRTRARSSVFSMPVSVAEDYADVCSERAQERIMKLNPLSAEEKKQQLKNKRRAMAELNFEEEREMKRMGAKEVEPDMLDAPQLAGDGGGESLNHTVGTVATAAPSTIAEVAPQVPEKFGYHGYTVTNLRRALWWSGWLVTEKTLKDIMAKHLPDCRHRLTFDQFMCVIAQMTCRTVVPENIQRLKIREDRSRKYRAIRKINMRERGKDGLFALANDVDMLPFWRRVDHLIDEILVTADVVGDDLGDLKKKSSLDKQRDAMMEAERQLHGLSAFLEYSSQYDPDVAKKDKEVKLAEVVRNQKAPEAKVSEVIGKGRFEDSTTAPLKERIHISYQNKTQAACGNDAASNFVPMRFLAREVKIPASIAEEGSEENGEGDDSRPQTAASGRSTTAKPETLYQRVIHTIEALDDVGMIAPVDTGGRQHVMFAGDQVSTGVNTKTPTSREITAAMTVLDSEITSRDVTVQRERRISGHDPFRGLSAMTSVYRSVDELMARFEMRQSMEAGAGTERRGSVASTGIGMEQFLEDRLIGEVPFQRLSTLMDTRMERERQSYGRVPLVPSPPKRDKIRTIADFKGRRARQLSNLPGRRPMPLSLEPGTRLTDDDNVLIGRGLGNRTARGSVTARI